VLSPSFYNVLRPIKMAESVVIKELIHKPFSVRPVHDNLRIVNKGNNSSQNQDRTKYKTFFISQYEKVDLLARCETTNKFLTFF
jgi:hypothetical protein